MPQEREAQVPEVITDVAPPKKKWDQEREMVPWLKNNNKKDYSWDS